MNEAEALSVHLWACSVLEIVPLGMPLSVRGRVRLAVRLALGVTP